MLTLGRHVTVALQILERHGLLRLNVERSSSLIARFSLRWLRDPMARLKPSTLANRPTALIGSAGRPTELNFQHASALAHGRRSIVMRALTPRRPDCSVFEDRNSPFVAVTLERDLRYSNPIGFTVAQGDRSVNCLCRGFERRQRIGLMGSQDSIVFHSSTRYEFIAPPTHFHSRRPPKGADALLNQSSIGGTQPTPKLVAPFWLQFHW